MPPVLSRKDPILALRNKTLSESLTKNSAWTGGKFFQKFLKEAILEGNISDETTDVLATQELLDQILMGAEGHVPLDFARVYTTDKAILNIPIGTYGAAVAISSGAFGNSPKTEAEVILAMDKEWGVEVSWTRAHLEDATWDVMSEQNQGAGYAIQNCLCEQLCIVLAAEGGATEVPLFVDKTSWAEWVAFLGLVDIALYGPADYCLVNAADYWTLLGIDQFVNSLYAGSDEVMRSGVAKTMLGITFIKVDWAGNYPVVLNSKKAIALAYRRQITVEPFEYPDANKYGFIASVRATSGMLNSLAAQRARSV